MKSRLRVFMCGVGVLIGIGAWASQEAPVNQQLLDALRAEQEKTAALAMSAANMRAQLAQAPQNCMAVIEKANPTKKVDPASFVLSDKPAAEKAPVK